jgi:hypothetical protein
MELSDLFFSSHLEEGERILRIAHRHFFILFKASVKSFFFGIVLPIALYLFFPQLVIVALIWLAMGIIVMFYHFIDWYFDAWIITNVAIIDIERNGLFDKKSKRIEYEMIDGIEYQITGFWQTILNFGDTSIDTMGTNLSLTLKDASNPKKLEKFITEYQEKYVNDKSFSDYNSLKTMLASMIAYHSKHGILDDKDDDKKKTKMK